jgi:hypothetical protein
MFSFENGPDIEAVSNASEFLGDTLNTRDNDNVLIYRIWRTVASLWLHDVVNEFFMVFIKHQMSYVLNFVVEIILILTYNLGSTLSRGVGGSTWNADNDMYVYRTFSWPTYDPSSGPRRPRTEEYH